MQHPIRANRITSIMALTIFSACSVDRAPISVPNRVGNPILIQNIDIGGEYVRSLEGQTVSILANIELTEYNTPALFPTGKNSDELDHGNCIDLVIPDDLRRRIIQNVDTESLIVGQFKFIGRLPEYTSSIRFGEISHVPICQVFTSINPYPYFVVDSIN